MVARIWICTNNELDNIHATIVSNDYLSAMNNIVPSSLSRSTDQIKKNGFIRVRRRDTIIEPIEIAYSNTLNRTLTWILISYSLVVVIMTFSGYSAPEYMDLGVSIFSLSTPVLFTLYRYFMYWQKPTNIIAPMAELQLDSQVSRESVSPEDISLTLGL